MKTELPAYLTTEIEVQTSNKARQKTRWLVTRCRPYPDFDHRMEWRNAGTLRPSYGNPATAPDPEYTAYLLASDAPDVPTVNRTCFAGFTHRPGPYGTPDVTNPGSIVFRGRDLGEMTLEIRPSSPAYPGIKVRGFDTPTTTERDFIREQIVTPLLAFINANARELASLAADALRADCLARVADARERLDTAASQIEGMARLLTA